MEVGDMGMLSLWLIREIGVDRMTEAAVERA